MHLYKTIAFALFGTVAAQTPTAAPPTTWDHGLTLQEKLTEWTTRYNTEFRLIRSGTCETALPPKINPTDPDGSPGTCQRFIGGDYYEFATEFPGGVIPLNVYTIENQDNDWAPAADSASLPHIVNRTFSLSGFTFRMTTLTTEPAGLSIDIVNKYVVFNNVPKDVEGGTTYSDQYQSCGDPSDDTGAYNTRMMCVCECGEATASPTASPTLAAGEDMTCSSMPTNLAYNNDGNEAPLDIGVSLYDEATNDLTVRPWINWNSKYLFQNLERNYGSEDYGKPFRKFIYQAHVDDYGACKSNDGYYPLFCTEAEAQSNSKNSIALSIANGRDSQNSGPAFMPDDPTFGVKANGDYTGDAPLCECSAGGDGHEVLADGSNLPQVTGWVDILPVKNYPYSDGIAPSPQCRFKLDANNEFAESVLPGYDADNMADPNQADACFSHSVGTETILREDGIRTYDRQYTNYSFYIATTLCYTNNDKATCEGPPADGGPFGTDGSWPSEAFLYPDKFHVAKKVEVGTDIAQCRRTWQKMEMKVNLGGFLEVLPDVSFTTTLAAEQDDASVTVPDQATEWQIFKDYDDFQLNTDHYIVNKYGPSDVSEPATWTALADSNGEGQDTFYFDKYYMMTFTLEQVTKLADYTIGYWLDQQYDNLLVKFTWKRKRESDGSWVDMSDRYKIHTTKTTATYDDDGVGGVYDPSFIQYVNEGNSLESEIDQPCLVAGCTNDLFNDVFTIKSKFEKRSQLFVEDAIRLDITLEYGGATAPARRRLSMTLMDGKLSESSEHRRLAEADNSTTLVSLGAVALLKDVLQSPTKLDVHYGEEHHSGNTSSMDLVLGFGILGVLVVMILLFSGCGGSVGTKAAQVIEFDGVRLLDK